MAVWHLHESMERLWDLAGAHRYLAFGSSGQYLDAKSEAWQGRIQEAFVTVNTRAEAFDEQRCWVHMMKFQSELKNFDFDSSDSTNFARNAHRFKKHGPGYLSLVSDRLKIKHTGVLDSRALAERSGAENPCDLTFHRRFESIKTSPLSDALRYARANTDDEFFSHFFHTAWADLVSMECAEMTEALEDLLHQNVGPSVYDVLVEANEVYKWLLMTATTPEGKSNARDLADFLTVYAAPFDQMQPSTTRLEAPGCKSQYKAMGKQAIESIPALTGSLGQAYKARKPARLESCDAKTRIDKSQQLGLFA